MAMHACCRSGCEVRVRWCVAMHACRCQGCEVRERWCVAMHACRSQGCEVRVRRCVAMHACCRLGCEVRVRRCVAMHACCRQGCEFRVRRCVAMHACCRSGCDGAWPCTLSRVGGSRSSDTLRNEQTWELRSTTYLRYYLLPLEGRCCSERCKLRGGTLHGRAGHPIVKLSQS